MPYWSCLRVVEAWGVPPSYNLKSLVTQHTNFPQISIYYIPYHNLHSIWVLYTGINITYCTMGLFKVLGPQLGNCQIGVYEFEVMPADEIGFSLGGSVLEDIG